MAIAIYARKSIERENSISCETQIEYCRSMLRPEEKAEEILTFTDCAWRGKLYTVVGAWKQGFDA